MTRQTVGNEERDGDLTVAGDLSVSGSVANPTFSGVAAFPDGSASAPSVTNDGDTNTGLFFPAADTVAVTTGGTERLRVDSGGRLLRGHTTSVPIGGINPLMQSHANASSATAAGMSLFNWQLGLQGNSLNFIKSRSGAIGTNAAVQSGDAIGTIGNAADDGSGFVSAVEIRTTVDGTVAAGDVPGRLGIFTKPSGGAITERMRIDSNGLITGTGTSLGAWTAYTPTLGGTGWALGDGTATGAYCQIGKIVHFRLQITFGSTSTFGGVAPTVTMPTGATELAQGVVGINCRFFDASLGNMYEGLVRNDGVNMSLRYYGTNALHEPVVSGGPFTWATTDFIRISGTYQAA